MLFATQPPDVARGILTIYYLVAFGGLFGFLLPRYLFYSTMFIAMLVLYPILYPPTLSPHNMIAFIFGTLEAAVSWTEIFRVWRVRAF